MFPGGVNKRTPFATRVQLGRAFTGQKPYPYSETANRAGSAPRGPSARENPARVSAARACRARQPRAVGGREICNQLISVTMARVRPRGVTQ
eukprot:scaffold35879_cov36-Phaeocystis_antarctica.AAC.1